MYISRGVRLYFFKNIVFFRLKIFFTFTNSVDSDEMQHNAAFHLGLHCLQKYMYSFRGFSEYKGLSRIDPDQLASEKLADQDPLSSTA